MSAFLQEKIHTEKKSIWGNARKHQISWPVFFYFLLFPNELADQVVYNVI